MISNQYSTAIHVERRLKVQQDLTAAKLSNHTIVSTMLAHHFIPVFITLLMVSISEQVRASGVFELELIKFQPLDVRPTPNYGNDSKIEHIDDQDPNKSIRIIVCLKEAFTSHLDGPCTFGNGSITLSKDSFEQEITSHLSSANQPGRAKKLSSKLKLSDIFNSTSIRQQQQPAGSLMTNIVRILFTFRWTKSFTIILTAEEPQIDETSRQPFSSSRAHANRRQQENAANKTTIDLSTGNESTEQESALINRPLYIDRHVLTENEVLPNLDSNPNKPWSGRFSRSLKSSLAYRFRVYCSLNYYGDGCTTFCRARDDQFGHYNCSTTGQKVCLDGWNGPDCDRAKCRPGCNQQHGFCDKPDTCQCRHGWTGSRCDECITYPGCQSGYCLSPWQCICQRNWGGVLCDQDLNYCGTHEPCKNNSTCQNIAPGKFKCNCLDGFTGVDCDIAINSTLNTMGSLAQQFSAGCAQNPCLNGGTCYGFNSLLVDSALTRPQQALAEAESPSSEQEPDRYYRCQCSPGWTGDYCQWSDSSSLSVTNIIINSTSDTPMQSNETSTSTISSELSSDDSINDADRNNSMTDYRVHPLLTQYVESTHQMPPVTHHMDMRHIISGVVVASAVGVFLASLFLAWCCLIAIERNRFPFIQMNIIRSEQGLNQPAVSSTFRQMHAKIRDSLRRSARHRIKPETKLSIENVLRPPQPPPTYEESSKLEKNTLSLIQKYNSQEFNEKISSNTRGECKIHELNQENLVIHQNTPATINDPPLQSSLTDIDSISDAHLTCPRHSHLYRQQLMPLSNKEGIYIPRRHHPSHH